MRLDINSEAIASNPLLFPVQPDEETELELKALTFYQQELKGLLPKEIFERTPSRAFFFVFYLSINISLISFVLVTNPAWYLKLLVAFVIGQMNASLGFFAHETLHGAIFKNKFLQNLIGSIGLAPFLVSVTYWRFWHNTLHHGNTQLIFKDPDAFPTLSVYKRSKFMRFVFDLTPGSGTPLSYFYFFYWFSFQSVLNQSYMRFGNKMWKNMNHRKVTREFIPLCILALSYIYLVGANNFLWLVFIPFCVQNYTILSYISTNHNISPLTKVNDPLENSLTVTTNRFWDFIHHNFGYHVEHHLFPRVSTRHVKKIHNLLKEKYPTKFKHMPKSKALMLLYKTPRIYKSSNELIHPKTQKVHSTI